jgi:uncharacterized protein (DUF2267 family)
MVLDYDVYAAPAREMLRKIAVALNSPDDPIRALGITRAVFMALRDTVAVDDSMKLIERLPDEIQMLYTDGWNRAKERIRHETAENFYNTVRNYSETVPLDFFDDTQTRQAVQAVFKVLRDPSTAGVIDNIKDQLPVALAANV